MTLTTGTARASRVYDYLLGARDLHVGPADRALAEALLAEQPAVRDLAKARARFTLASTAWLARRGIGQYICLSWGRLTAARAVHEIAREIIPDAAVAYVGDDASTTAHLAHEVRGGAGLAAVCADPSDPAAVLKDPALAGIIDPSRPAAVITARALGQMDATAAREAVAGYAAALEPGSYLSIAVSHFADAAVARRMSALLAGAGMTWHDHGPEAVASYFAAGNLKVAGGRVADVSYWPALPPEIPASGAILGGIGRKG